MTGKSAFRSPIQAARSLGLSAKTLRVWERMGLLHPGRTSAGWRVYGPDEFARIHQILALKGLGLGLAAIVDLLRGRLADLDAVLAVQEQALRLRKAEAERALALIAAARSRLAAGGALSPDDLATLTRETTVTKTLSEDEWREIFEPLAAKHYTPAELEAVKARKQEAGVAWKFDQAAVTKAWDALIAEARTLVAKGDPTTPEAIDLARRWNAMVEQFTGGDPTLADRARSVWQDAMADPATAPRLPIDLEMFAFVRAATEAGRR